MKVANAIAEFLRDKGIRHVFLVSGGANFHLIRAIAHTDGIEYVCCQGEQGASFAADAYAYLNGVGCALTTSGPGATNLVTGISASYYDSRPVLYVCGNQTRERLGTGYGVRQLGFQATPICEIVKPITKFAHTIMHPSEVLQTLGHAMWIAEEGRPGPVLVDIPDDIQRAELA